MSYSWLPKHWPAIVRMATAYAFDPHFIAAFVAQESGGVEKRMRYEPAWHFFNAPEKYAKALGISADTEQRLQCFSFGLMQVMGATARDMGFAGYLVDLCDPDIGLSVACQFLDKKRKTYTDQKDLIASFNAGTPRKDASGKYFNQRYVDELLAHYAALKGA